MTLPGTYLIRYGASNNEYICSYVTPDEAIMHTELKIAPLGLSLSLSLSLSFSFS